ncbi:MAG: hypothetical protein KY442_00565 [Proteobacteria bacterium]|nr:hypothetical protein [Pseudomonadota bacterium]
MSLSNSHGKQGLSAVTLLFSLGTLLCCALPLLLVTLGMGSVVAAMTSTAPWLVTLSQYKGWMFAGSALTLALAGWALYRAGRSCPGDPVLAAACARADRWSRRVWLGSVLIWVGAAFVAFLWLPLRLAFS